MKSEYRGHKIKFKKEVWLYNDTNKPVKDDINISCGHCGQPITKEGYDACLGILPEVINACCGHGNIQEAYIQFSNGIRAYGKDAFLIIKVLKRDLRNENKYRN